MPTTFNECLVSGNYWITSRNRFQHGSDASAGAFRFKFSFLGNRFPPTLCNRILMQPHCNFRFHFENLLQSSTPPGMIMMLQLWKQLQDSELICNKNNWKIFRKLFSMLIERVTKCKLRFGDWFSAEVITLIDFLGCECGIARGISMTFDQV